MKRPVGGQPRLLGIRVDEFGDAVHQRMFQPLLDRPFAPAEVAFLGLLRASAAEAFGDLQHLLRRRAAGLRYAVQHHVFTGLSQGRVDLVIDGQLPRVDDAHVHPRLNGVVEEHRMHRLPHRLVAAEGEGEVGNTARDMRMGQGCPNLARGLDEIDTIVVVFLDPGCHREDVRVEDDVLRREIDFLGEDAIGARADLDLPRLGIRLPGLVEGHDHHRSAIGPAELRVVQESLLAFLERNGIDHRLALHAFQAGLDHLPLGTVDHHRHAGDVWFRGDKVEIGGHRLLRVDEPLVHVDVDDLGAVLHLIARHIQRGGVVAVGDELAEARGAGDICPLPHVHEGDIWGQDEGFQP